jgi:hypothetical protein
MPSPGRGVAVRGPRDAAQCAATGRDDVQYYVTCRLIQETLEERREALEKLKDGEN